MNLTGTQFQSRVRAAGPAPTPAPGGLLRRAGVHGGVRDGALSAVRETLDAPGQPLCASTRALVEPRLGHSFADVRVHTDERAVASARTVGARAYTVGNHVVFNSGRYAPQTTAGLHLLAHELAHVVQQQGSASAEPFAPASDKNDPQSYAAQVAKKMKVPETTLVKTMSDEQIAIFADAIQEVEGWHVGTEKPRGDASLPEEVRRRT